MLKAISFLAIWAGVMYVIDPSFMSTLMTRVSDNVTTPINAPDSCDNPSTQKQAAHVVSEIVSDSYNFRPNPYYNTAQPMVNTQATIALNEKMNAAAARGDSPAKILKDAGREISADRTLQCVADIVTNHGDQMLMYFGWQEIHGKTYVKAVATE